MTEYWVSKKQYWCKYCSIWIRDDAPSRKHHETGLKHQGQKERFIRDIYKSGNQAKRDKEAEAIEIARIERAASAAHAKDVHLPSAKASLLSSARPVASASSSRLREKPKDKFANYSSAKDLGFDDVDTQKTAYEIEQEIKGRSGEPGGWEVVEEQPEPQYYPDAESSVVAGKRKLGEYEVNEEEDAETFKFQHKDKRPVRDPYDDDEWDPKKALGGLKIKTKEQKMFETNKEQSPQSAVKDEKQNEGGLDREKWSGRLELQEGPSRPGMVFAPNGGGWVKTEGSSSQPAEEVNQEPVDQKPSFEEEADVTVPGSDKAQIAMQAPEAESETAPLDVKPNSAATETETPAAGLFKKRRPPPSNRKK